MGTNDYWPGKYQSEASEVKTSCPAQRYKPVHGGYPTAEKSTTHAERVEVRQAINGQPNGYRPTSELELKGLDQLSPAHDEGRCDPIGVFPDNVTLPVNPVPGSEWNSDNEWPGAPNSGADEFDAVLLLRAIHLRVAELNSLAGKLAYALGKYRNGDRSARGLIELQNAYMNAWSPEFNAIMEVEATASTINACPRACTSNV